MKPAFVLRLAMIVSISSTMACARSTLSDHAPDETAAVASSPTSSTATASSVETAATPSAGQADLAKARALLSKFLEPHADRTTLTRSLKPTSEDYAALFGENAGAAEAYYEKIWRARGLTIIVGPNTHTELLVFGGSTEEVITHPGDWPPEYARAKLKAGLPIYRWQFVEPGQTTGTGGDGLVFVHGHFAFFPRPWLAA